MMESFDDTYERYDRIDERRQLLEEFAEHPRDDAVWDRAYEWLVEAGFDKHLLAIAQR